VSVGEFEDAYGNIYLLVLNRDFDGAKTVELKFKENVRLYSVSRITGRQELMDGEGTSYAFDLAAGDAVLVRVQSAAEEPYTIEYRLEKNL
jgi:dipeptidyl aminopeptidase/acylaminoacyl peptidase